MVFFDTTSIYFEGQGGAYTLDIRATAVGGLGLHHLYRAMTFLGQKIHARFLVLPWVRSKSRTSRILSIAARGLPHEWQSRYGYRSVLLETFVEKARFEDTYYKTAN